MVSPPASSSPLIERSPEALRGIRGREAHGSAIVGTGPDGGSHILRGRSAGPLRLLFPRATRGAAWVVTSSLGGGLVDGDVVGLELAVQARAAAVLTTQSSTKVYRGASSQRLHVGLDDDATALILPDPVVPFRDADFTQKTTVALRASSSVALVDAYTAGRVAFGERWDATRIDSTLTISIDGVTRLVDRVLLRQRTLALKMNRFDALATLVLVGPRFEEDAALLLASIADAPVRPGAEVVRVACPFEGGAIVRIAATTVARLIDATRELMRAPCARLGEAPWARKW